MIQYAHVGDTDTEILLDTKRDLTNADSVAIVITRPDGTEAIRVGQVYDTTWVRYKTQATDFTIPGLYYLKPKVTLQYAAWSGSGNTAELEVLE